MHHLQGRMVFASNFSGGVHGFRQLPLPPPPPPPLLLRLLRDESLALALTR